MGLTQKDTKIDLYFLATKVMATRRNARWEFKRKQNAVVTYAHRQIVDVNTHIS